MSTPLDPKKVLQQVKAGMASAAGATSFEAPTIAALEPQFPGLRIHELIGRGGMGSVYRATDLKLEREVALKILPEELAADPAFVERFAREARALARLDHPNILRVFDTGQAGQWCYLITEFVDGANLRQLMDQGKLSPHETLRLVPAICEALQAAHDQGVVHRDIKPENLLLDQDGIVKIADFGLAKVASETGDNLTRSDQALGTAHYIAPEQMTASAEVDHRADIFSLGVVFYELLTGQLPHGNFHPPSRHARMPRNLDRVVMRSLERDPRHRYQSALDLKRDVEHGDVTDVKARAQRRRDEALSLRQTQNELLPWFGAGLVIVGATSMPWLAPLLAHLLGAMFGTILALLPIAAGCALGWRALSRGVPSGWWLSWTAAYTAAYLPLLLLAEACTIGLPVDLLSRAFNETDAFLISAFALLVVDAVIIAMAVRNRLRR